MMPEKGDPGITFAGILILAALSAFFWKAAPLESARPISDRPEVYIGVDERIQARLWQDPFKTLYQQLKQAQAERQAPGRWPDVRRELGAGAKDGEVVLLPVMITPGPYAEIEERRRRRRYAVLAGLGESGFVPRDAEHLGAFCIGFPEQAPGDGVAENGEAKAVPIPARRRLCQTDSANQYPVPYEWFDHEDPNRGKKTGRSALVVWLDESQIADRPLGRLRQLLESLLEDLPPAKRQRIRVAVLGPARSSTLASIIREHEQDSPAVRWLEEESDLKAFEILSPAATVADKDLGQVWEFRKKFPAAGSSETGKTALRFLRTIQSDDRLAEGLMEELDARQFDFQNDHLVVISEWDTYFGRALPRELKNAFIDKRKSLKSKDPGNSSPESRIRLYTYQRGIDGIVPGASHSATKRAETNARKSSDSEFPLDLAESVRQPAGTGQFDYLRRLAYVISTHDNRLRLETGKGVRAVAILGSDVYDKLLILRALRRQLSGAIWLTTDLDAQLTHPAEFRWARNLIVASTYGLRLADEFQRATPPFRDSYQTSVFLAAQMALDSQKREALVTPPKSDDSSPHQDPHQNAFYLRIPPYRFEIGRGVLAAFSPQTNSSPTSDRVQGAPVQPVNRVEPISFSVPVFFGLFMIGVLGIIAVNQMLPRSGELVLGLIFLVILLSAFTRVVLTQTEDGEPLGLVSGVSIWPTEYLRLILLFLTLTFIFLVLRRLRRNWENMQQRYFGIGRANVTEPLTLSDVLWKLRPRGLPTPQWALASVIFGVLPMFVMKSLREFAYPLEIRLLILACFWSLVIAIWWLLIFGRFTPNIRVRSINQWVMSAPGGSPLHLWGEYGAHGENQHRVLRTLSYLLVYMAFGSVIFTVLGPPMAPCRGDLACRVDGMLIGLCVVTMLFLLFLVVDATRLCISWIQLMRKAGLDWNTRDQDSCAAKFNLPGKHCVAWIQVRMIGERTGEVSRLIYYPMLVILLLLLSRSTIFDDWGFPKPLAIIVGINFGIALVAAVRLNSVARTARAEIFDELRREQLELAADRSGPQPKPTPGEIKELMEQLEKLRIGAYVEIWNQPVVRAFLFLLGGAGISFSQYLPSL